MCQIYMLKEDSEETLNPTQWSDDIENVLGKIRES